MPTKRCSWGTCNSDSRYPTRPYMADVLFYPFPKPKTQPEKCLNWIKACGRPHEQLNTDKIIRHHFVCSKVCQSYIMIVTCLTMLVNSIALLTLWLLGTVNVNASVLLQYRCLPHAHCTTTGHGLARLQKQTKYCRQHANRIRCVVFILCQLWNPDQVHAVLL